MNTIAADAALRQIRSDVSRRKIFDQVFVIVGLLIMFSALLVLVLLFINLVQTGAPRLNWDFLTQFPSRKAERAGILSAWVGTSLIMLTTAAVAMPVGVAAAIYLEEYAPKNWMTAIIEINVTNLAGVPSIIYGLLALGLFVYQFNLGQSIAAAGLTLSLLILPIVIVATREALRAVPRAIREAAYALGATRWEVTAHHVLPYSTGGILTGMIIGLSRAIGETAPLITIGALSFIAFLPESPFKGEFPFFSFAWLKEGFTAMPIQMFNWVSRPDPAFPGQCRCGRCNSSRHDSADEWRSHLCPLPLPQEDQLVSTLQPGSTTHESPARPAAGTHAFDGRLKTPKPSIDTMRGPAVAQESLAIKARAENLSFHYGEVQALKGLNIEIREKQVTALIGPSGCGKTTFLRCFNRMHDLTPGTRYEGRIMLYPDELDLVGKGVDAIEVRMRIGMVFQKPNPFPKSIFENVAYGLRVRGVRSNARVEEEVEKALRRAAIWDEVKDRLDSSGLSLSGGQQQRLCIARALATNPEILLFDEPTSALDPIATARIEELIAELRDQVTVIIVTHNMQQAARVSDYTAFMYLGELIEFDNTSKLFTNPSQKATEDYITGRYG